MKRKKNRNDMSAKELRLNELLVEKLKFYMAEKDLSIHDVSMLISKDPKTTWQFLHQKVKPHDRTIYLRISHLPYHDSLTPTGKRRSKLSSY
ncbi:hypothetical protein ES703_94377 [subsurface metagenome]